MSTSTSTSPARQLVKAFAEIATTEELVLFIAATDNMLGFCEKLVEQYDREVQGPLVQEVNAQCASLAVLPGALFAEIRKVLLALNRFHDANRNHYAVLGLPEEADRDRVKKAYRELSKQYHPDKQPDTAQGAERFMEITGAYHALMTAPTTQKRAPRKTSWRTHEPRRSRSKRDQRRFFLSLFIIVFLLVGASIFLSVHYNRSVLSHQVNAYRKQPQPNQAKPSTAPLTVADKSAVPTLFMETVPTVPQAEGQTKTAAFREENDSTRQESVSVSVGIPRLPAREETPEPDPGLASISSLAEPAIPDFPDEPLAKNAPEPALAPPEPTRTATAAASAFPAATKPHQDDQLTDSERIKAINTSLEISSLVNHYSSFYNNRDLDAFLALFSNDATENGSPLAELIDQYRSLFTHTKNIDLTVADLAWNKVQDGFQAHGSFQVSYTYRDSEKRNYTGNISFNLVRQQSNLKIRTLNYEFD